MTSRYENDGILLVAQVDHLSGELLAEGVDMLYSAGAMNVQVLPGLTKKGRPGHVLLVDVPGGALCGIEDVLAVELGIGGWHLVPTRHVHLETRIVVRDLAVLADGGTLRTHVQGKVTGGDGSAAVPEHRSCVEIRRQIEAELGVRVPLRDVRRLVGAALNGGGEATIDLRGRGEARPALDADK